jgi:hypothetical protein
MTRLRLLVCQVLGLWLAATAALPAHPDRLGAGDEPPPKVTDEDVARMKTTHYEVDRVVTKYQPVITDYQGEELPQLCYDTRQEAQQRVDEINYWDRLDKLGVEGQQNKKVEIREVKRESREPVRDEDLKAVAKRLAKEKRYAANDKTTHCNQFVRDLTHEILNRYVPELEGRASEQLAQLKAASAHADSPWRSLSFQDDPAGAFANAQELANSGKLVVVAIPGHVAVVIPSTEGLDGLYESKKSKSGDRGWGMRVPYIAQAGSTVSDSMPLSEGFRPSSKSSMEIFVLTP